MNLMKSLIPAAAIVALLVVSVLATIPGGLESGAAPAGGLEDGAGAGVKLFTRYLVPFELLSVLLLGAIFGALVIARAETRR